MSHVFFNMIPCSVAKLNISTISETTINQNPTYLHASQKISMQFSRIKQPFPSKPACSLQNSRNYAEAITILTQQNHPQTIPKSNSTHHELPKGCSHNNTLF